MSFVIEGANCKTHFAPPSRVRRQRTEIALLHQNDVCSPRIAWFERCHVRTVGRWLTRIASGEPISDRPRSGRPVVFDQRTRLRTIAFFCQAPRLPGCNRWTLSDATRHLKVHPEIVGCSMSRASVGRILSRHALRPHLRRYFLQITDPEFFPKMEHIICLYLHPPEHLFCFDECTGIQAIERLAPNLPATPGQPLTKEFHYRRHGTTDLIAFLKPADGGVFCRCTENHNTETLSRVFREHVQLQPADARLHYICDNLSTHFHDQFCSTVAELSGLSYKPLKSGAERRRWLQSDGKRITIHFVPFHGSWLNLIEIWFGILAGKCLKDGWYKSVDALIESMMDFARTWDEHFAHPFTWTYRGEGLHGKAVRRFRRLLQIGIPRMEIGFLTKQLLLMAGLVGDYWSQVEANDWQGLLNVLTQEQSYLVEVIGSAAKHRQKEKAERALEELTRLLYDSLLRRDAKATPA